MAWTTCGMALMLSFTLALIQGGCDETAGRADLSADAHGADLSRADGSKVDASKTDAPGTDAKRADAKATDAKKADAKATDAKKADAKKADAKKTDAKGDAAPPATCDLSATPSTLASVFAAAPAGKTICLASGAYGNFTGGNKSGTVTIRPQAGAAATISLDFSSANNIRIEGLTIAAASLRNTTKNITITGCQFTGAAAIDGVTNSNIVFDQNTHINIMTCASCYAGRIQLPYSNATHSGVTVKNSLLKGGNADGIQAGTGLDIINNEFAEIRETGPTDPAHTDAIQLLGASGTVVRANYIHHCADGIVAYDGIDHALIEDNVIDLVDGRWGIELYSDDSSIVRHNTLKYGTGCSYAPCGHIVLDHKTADPPGQGTVVVDNIATVISAANGSTFAARHHNLLPSGAASGDLTGTPTFVGGASPTTWAGFKLAAGSTGKAAASDGMDIGIH